MLTLDKLLDDRDGVADAYFRRFRLSNGTFKTTGRGRLRETDTFLIEHLPKGIDLRILDIGVSSATTSVELFDRVTPDHPGVRVVATDLTLFVGLAQRRGITACWELSKGGLPTHLLQVDLFGIACPNSRAATLPLFWLLRPVAPKADIRRVPFVSALAARRAAETGRFSLESFDVLTGEGTVEGDFDVVRAANILNRAYFDDSRLRAAIGVIFRRMRDGGVLLIGRTDTDGTTAASCFTKGPESFESRADLNGGAEIKDLVLAHRNDRGRPSEPRAERSSDGTPG